MLGAEQVLFLTMSVPMSVCACVCAHKKNEKLLIKTGMENHGDSMVFHGKPWFGPMGFHGMSMESSWNNQI